MKTTINKNFVTFNGKDEWTKIRKINIFDTLSRSSRQYTLSNFPDEGRVLEVRVILKNNNKKANALIFLFYFLTFVRISLFCNPVLFFLFLSFSLSLFLSFFFSFFLISSRPHLLFVTVIVLFSCFASLFVHLFFPPFHVCLVFL